MSVMWMTARGVESAPQVIGSVPPQTVYVHDSLSIPLRLSDLFTDHFTVQMEHCSLASCELQGGPHSNTGAPIGSIDDVAVQGDYAVVVGSLRVIIVNISDPLSPSVISNLDTGMPIDSVAVKGNYAYIGAAIAFIIVDISDPLSLSVSGSLDITCLGVFVEGNYGYCGSPFGFQIVDISDPSNPSLLSTISGISWSNGMRVRDNYAYIVGSLVYVVDISNPSSPTIVHDVSAGSSDIAMEGNYVYATGGSGLAIVDIANPASASVVTRLDVGNARRVEVEGGFAFVATIANGLQVVNVSDPTSPFVVASVNIGVSGMTLQGGYIYVANSNGLRILSDMNTLVVSPDTSNRNNETLSLRGCDLSGECSDPLEIHVTVPNRDPVLSFDGESVISLHVGDLFPHSIYFTDLDGDILNVTISSLPLGWSFSSSTTDQNRRADISIEGSLQSGSQGNWSIELNGGDEYGGSASLEIHVNVVNRPPVVNPNKTPSSSFDVAPQVSFEYSFDEDVFVDEDGDPLELFATLSDGSPLPPHLQFESENPTLTGNLSESELVRFQARDPFDGIAFFEVHFQVIETSTTEAEASDTLTTTDSEDDNINSGTEDSEEDNNAMNGVPANTVPVAVLTLISSLLLVL